MHKCRTTLNLRKLVSLSASTVVATLVLLAQSSSAVVINVFNDFATDLGTWNTTAFLQQNGFDLGYRTTGWTGGSAGYVGGLVIRSNNPVSPTAPGMPRILDTQSFLGGPADLNHSITFSGKMFLQDVGGTANSDINFGLFNSSIADPSSQRLVLRIHSPSPDYAWRFRFGYGGGSQSNAERLPAPTGWDSQTLDFVFKFLPSGANDGSGVFYGNISFGSQKLQLVNLNVVPNSWTFDSFGMWVDSAGGTDVNALQNMYFDNVTLTVIPEPSTLLLLPVGALVLLARRAFRRA